MKVKIQKEGKTKSYNIVDSWDEVTLEKWQQVATNKKDSTTEEAIAMIKALSDLPVKLVKEMALADVATIFERVSKLQVKGKHKKIFKIDDIEYGFMPDLEEITLGEYADIETYIKDGLEKNLHKIMAVLFRPVTDKEGKLYSIEAYTGVRERAEKFRKKMNTTQVQQALVFFWTLGQEFSKILPQFLVEKMEKIKAETALLKSGGTLE